ncbi:pyrimidine-nucleoside phosphorylase [uncultured Marinococcus sp.]|uniref:pyrimidine-nucleoside phosphorylase n=1 Tax=uncultured Marinococcus sp. TaxID=487012 RepID=UPI0026071B24|nr:pyrimidine-nucleoside phosphorylase [uncultured Marinococcus sp.]
MRMVDIIAKKRDGKELSEEEIRWFVESYSNGEVPDYQTSAFAMAIYFQDMTQKESAALTYAMAESGDQLDLSAIEGIKVDKHSTGGVGDKTTLIIGPIVAACGVPVAKMSGRGLGHTGGTIDKLESFRGFETEIPKEEFVNLVNEHKIAVAGQSGNLTPADKKLYALRDVTATVNSIPLIASSVMSKKIAAGADAIVLDVKAGSGAFMKEVKEAKRLAEAMVEIGQSLDRKTMAVISNMDQPLGRTVGNALEVKEAIETLQGNGPEDLHELSVTLSSYMLVAGGKADTLEQAEKMVLQVIENGDALEKMKAFVQNQHGDASAVDNPDGLAAAEHRVEVKAEASGYVHGIEAEEIGVSAMLLGAGRATKDDVLDYSVGIELTKKIGDPVQKGDTIAIMHVNDQNSAESARKISEAFTIAEAAVEKPVLIYETVQ